MPTFDGGHCFLTALLPIKTGEIVDDSGMASSPVHMVRDALAILPTARQSPVTASLPISPFAKTVTTHFARMAVIDNVIYNGRCATNTLLDQSDRTIGQPVDELPGPYLMLVIDFDAPKGTQAELRVYLRSMWEEMRAELHPVFRHCFEYDAKAVSADGFADYIIACQIETTMPFNDYWSVPLKLPSLTHTLWMAGIWTWVVAGLALYIAFHALGWIGAPGASEILALAILAAVPALYVVYRLIMGHGAKPFPVAPHCDLASILKALYLQRQLISFAIAMQGKSSASLHAAFGDFLQKHRVHDKDDPTQAPGTILF